MNRRDFLTAIPAAVAALTASKSLAGATSPVDASAAIVGAIPCYLAITGVDAEVLLTPNAEGLYAMATDAVEHYGHIEYVPPILEYVSVDHDAWWGAMDEVVSVKVE